jgi:hypothetical protein
MKAIIKSLILSLLTMATLGASAQVVTVVNPQLKPRAVYDLAYYSNIANYTVGAEIASVGAQMPYYVMRDPNINGTLFDPSTFVWTLTGVASFTDFTLGTAIASGAEVPSNMVIATMPATTSTITILKVQEKGYPKAYPVGAIDPVGVSLPITIVSLPNCTITTANIGGTGVFKASNAYDIACTLTGTAPFYINYTITGIDLNATPIGSVTGERYQATIDLITDKIHIDTTQFSHLGGNGVTSPIRGIYYITIDTIWDAVSFKAINAKSLGIKVGSTITAPVFPDVITSKIMRIKAQ